MKNGEKVAMRQNEVNQEMILGGKLRGHISDWRLIKGLLAILWEAELGIKVVRSHLVPFDAFQSGENAGSIIPKKYLMLYVLVV